MAITKSRQVQASTDCFAIHVPFWFPKLWWCHKKTKDSTYCKNVLAKSSTIYLFLHHTLSLSFFLHVSFFILCALCSWAMTPLSFALQSTINYLSACIIHSTSLLNTDGALQSLLFRKPSKSPFLSLLLIPSFGSSTKSWPIHSTSIHCQHVFFFLSSPRSPLSCSLALLSFFSWSFRLYLAL